MAFKQKLEQRQKFVFSQSLKQSIKLLELPLLELKDTIETEIEENPVIEEISAEPSREAAPEKPQGPAEEEDLSYLDREETIGELVNYERPIPNKKESLFDFLLKQLRMTAKDEAELKIGTLLIHQIDENGYLRRDIPALCAEAECSEETALKTLKLIQTFDPAGVAARDLKECLMIQLKKMDNEDCLSLKVVEGHLSDLASGNLKKLCKKLKCSEEEMRLCIQKIQRLEPKPGRSYDQDEIAYVIPDIAIEEKDNELFISAKDDTLPVIRINPLYKKMLKSKTVNEETKEFIRQKMMQANNLVHAIQSRRNTIVKVVTIIAEIQKEAILEGIDKIKPLTLREIAEKIGMHESTVSRVVMHKYVQTPAGILRLKDFFSGSLKSAQGEEIASQNVKLKVKDLIDNEDKALPLRDQAIADLLKETEKIAIARRTIAKYREMQDIPPVSKRRRPA